MKVKRLVVTAVVAGALLGVTIPSLAQGPADSTGTTVTRRAGQSETFGIGGAWQSGTLVAGDLEQSEIDGLLYMREEEKLAHDLYSAFYGLYGLEEFNTIAASEARHEESILQKLEQAGIADPSEGLAEGEFSNSDLQALYDELLARGSQSLEDALRVGAEVEELDILDLQERSAATDNAALVRTYANLERGSGSHLRSYVALLESEVGVTYAPSSLSAEDYQAILDASNGSAYGRSMGRDMTGECDGTGTLSADDNGQSTDGGLGTGSGGFMGRGGRR